MLLFDKAARRHGAAAPVTESPSPLATAARKIRTQHLKTTGCRVPILILRNAAGLRCPLHLGPCRQNAVLAGAGQNVSPLVDGHRALGVISQGKTWDAESGGL